MNENIHPNILRLRNTLLIIWLTILIVILYTYFFQHDFFQYYLKSIFAAGIIGYVFYFFLGCIRGFTLIPATYLTVFGLLFFPPIYLFILTLLGILISSLFIYHFSESFHLYKFFEHKHKKSIDKIKREINKNELLIVVTWNLLPIVPADLIAYVCGILKTDKHKFLLGTLIGQGIYSAILIFLGHYIIKIFVV